MKKLICNALLIFGLFESNHASALPVVDAGNIVQSTISAVQNGLTALSTAAIEAKTEVMAAWEHSSWVQQLKSMWDSLQKLQQQFEELVGLRDDLMNTLSGARDLGGWIPTTNASDPNAVNYRYASQLPQDYLPTITCSSSGTGCTVSGTGYTGIALPNVNSASIRNAWRVNTTGISFTANDINKISNEAAERYAQEIAIIQAMAQEAYTQANNRIAKIEELQAKLTKAKDAVNSKSSIGHTAQSGFSVDTPEINIEHIVDSMATPATQGTSATANQYDGNGRVTYNGTPAVSGTAGHESYQVKSTKTVGAASVSIIGDSVAPTTNASDTPSTNRNDLKFIADLQAQIQLQQALLLNEQNKLAALAILQQSLHDAYEQRKKEIAAYVVDGKSRDDFMVSLGKVGVAAAQEASYKLVKGWYD